MPIVRDQSYEHFAEVIGNKVAESVGSEPSWQQVAFLFKLSQSTISLASKGSKAAANVKEWTLRYFEDKVANWVVGQGGWVSSTFNYYKKEEYMGGSKMRWMRWVIWVGIVGD